MAEPEKSCPKQVSCLSSPSAFLAWTDKRFFIIFVVIAILVAYAYPDAGAKGGDLEPKITTGWIAVCIIFLLSGWSLKTKELVKAALYCRLNTAVQLFNLGVIPLVFFAVVKILEKTSMNEQLVEGMVIMACLPTTVSMCVVLTKNVGGNDAAAIFNAASGNILGIVATPALVLLYVGNKSTVPFAEVLIKLVLKVLVPLLCGQVIQYAGARDFYVRNKTRFKRTQEILLLCIIYTTFCQTFKANFKIGGEDIVIIVVIEVVLYFCFCASILWLTGLECFKFTRADRAAILFCATHKTVAMGIPLLNTMFEGNPDLGLYVVPLLIYHPMQLLVGSVAGERLGPWVAADPNAEPDPDAPEAQASKDVEEDKELTQYADVSQKAKI